MPTFVRSTRPVAESGGGLIPATQEPTTINVFPGYCSGWLLAIIFPLFERVIVVMIDFMPNCPISDRFSPIPEMKPTIIELDEQYHPNVNAT